jgi:hypothetical protein
VKPRVVYWNNIPAPYIVEGFNTLAERGNIEFEVWFSTRTESKNRRDLSLLLVGDGTDEARLRKRCADEGLEDVVFAGFHDDDAESLCARMALLAGEDSLRSRIGETATAKVAGQSPHLWAEAFEQAIDELLSLSPISPVTCRT